MPIATVVPEKFLTEPFHRHELVAAGLSPKLLLGKRFQRVFPGVWKSVELALTHAQVLTAARKAMPARAGLSHISRIQDLGLDVGLHEPVHFTIAGDLHLDLDGIYLHRTAAMPPLRGNGVAPAAAFIQCCSTMALIEIVVIGDWLLHEGHMTIPELKHMIQRQKWRPGAKQARKVIRFLDPASRSPQESRLRMCIIMSGLPAPEVNADVFDSAGRRVAIVDLYFRAWRLVLEYEGRQHAESARQFQRDIDRYRDLRRLHVEYLQVTAAMLAQPKALMLSVYHRLSELGFSGPAPEFGTRWLGLFRPIPL
jgi:hypothetical protein